MQKLIVKLFLLAVISAVIVQAAVVSHSKNEVKRFRKGFRFLGTMNKTRVVTRYGVTSNINEDWDYWASVNEAGWAEAARDCVANGDTLLYIETKEEIGNVTEWLRDSDSTGSLYWVGGKWDLRSEAFIWDNGVPISPEAPWGPGQPKDKKSNTRVAAVTVGGEIEYKTEANTKTIRYICEGQREDEDEEQIPVPCYKDNDLIIVVDSSGSISQTHYEIAKEFTARLATTWVDHNNSRVSVIIFSTDTQIIFSLIDDQSVPTMKEKIYNMPHMAGGTNTHRALDLVRSEFEKHYRNVTQNLVLLTDGQSANPAATKASADAVIAAGIRSHAVGIGSSIGQAELLVIAGGHADRVFTTDQFDELLALLRPLSKKVCE